TARLLAAIGIANHDNLGALLRNAAAFGVDMVALDATCCDPLYRKAIRVSVGAALSLPIAFADDGPAMLRTLAAHDVQVLALSPSADREVSSITPHARCALLVGSEGAGLAPDILAACDPVRITMAAGWDSLNVATSAAIALYELTRRT
ncbi:MAG: RNA methyltransferase, partial [Hyphomicrobiales bacterium]|nr:RNA methyltransferase [Hyphomicrobiales bacterium]